jgi:methylenetetrahydrofolate reductase (NADPH)
MKSGSNLELLLTGGNFVVTAELGPPKGASAEDIIAKVHLLRGYVDAANITDNQTAVVRMSSIAAGAMLVREGLEPIIQMVTRDRNRIAIQSDALGAAALGIKNCLCLTGDHPKLGNHPKAKSVFDIDSIQLIQMLRNLRDQKVFDNGEKVEKVECRFFLGAAWSPLSDPQPIRPVRLAKKIAAGADFIQTQAVFDVKAFEDKMKLIRERDLHKKTHILAGIIPAKSLGMVRYMREYVPGVVVPDWVVSRMEGAKDKKREGIEIAVEIINELRQIEGICGIHIMAVNWEEAVPEVTEKAGLLPRPAARVIPEVVPAMPPLRKEVPVGERHKVLLVDDDPDLIAPMQVVFEAEGFLVDTAADGVIALEKVKANRPDLIVLDLLMPRKDGFAVCSELKADPLYAEIPVIILTSVKQSAAQRRYELEKGLALDVADYAEKPVDPLELVNRVKKVLGARK